ncbi:MAG TPA: hypothetical protein VI603_07230 [Saprospiraceae bacterium]|nr:hypothetical protein [Saprospiraceae bacterium]
MAAKRTGTSRKVCVKIPIDGTAKQLSKLFSYGIETQKSDLTSLEEYIAHTFNQTLVRDHFYGAWAEVLKDKGKYILKMYSPHHDLSIYERLIPAYLEAGRVALSLFEDNRKNVRKYGKKQMRFSLPFGLCMAKAKSVQLLHFPPLETFVYQDYLYSPTNRRWENLIAYNEVAAVNFAEMESIVDCVPIAAPGGDSEGISHFNETFTPYVMKMLQARLDPSGKTTQPVVAYGEPVRAWLEKTFSGQIRTQIKDGRLQTLSLIELRLFNSGVTTPVLCANHPSKYLYYTDDTDPAHFDEKKDIMTQDLIAAGWQAKMAYQPKGSPHKVLQHLQKHWTNNPQVLKIITQEDQAYGYKL